jgi:3-methyladenine DNA glycosylase Tag
MDTVTVNAEEWKELVCKIDRIAGFIEQYAEHLPTDDNVWLDETQVCDYLKISPKTLQRLRKSGDIKFSTVAKKHHYKAGDVKALMERNAVKSSREQIEKLRSSYKTLIPKARNG